MHPSDVVRIVKRYAEAVGLDPSKYSGHSLRAGFVTSAAIHRARLDKIMEVTRHTNPPHGPPLCPSGKRLRGPRRRRVPLTKVCRRQASQRAPPAAAASGFLYLRSAHSRKGLDNVKY